MSLGTQFKNALATSMGLHGFKHQKGLTYTVELENGVSGWVSVQLAKSSGPPFMALANAGLCHVEIQKVIDDLRGYENDPKSISPICFSSLSHLLGGSPNGLAWLVDEANTDKVALEIADLCSGKLMKFFKKHAHPKCLIDLISKGFGERNSNSYAVPLLYSKIGKPQLALAALDRAEVGHVAPDFFQNRERLRSLL